MNFVAGMIKGLCSALLLPMLLIHSEMNLWLGYRALKPGESTLIEVQLSQLQARAATSLALTPLSSEVSVSALVRQGKLGLAAGCLPRQRKEPRKFSSQPSKAHMIFRSLFQNLLH